MTYTTEQLQEILRLHKLWLDGNSLGKCANLQRADLRGADLGGANLSYANLYGANLGDANLQRANLQDANLRGADLQDADLRGADLQDADLQDADLQGASLIGASLIGADLSGAKFNKLTKFCSVSMLLLISWGTLSNKLCLEAMRYDAANHPEGTKKFNNWKKTGVCPYINCQVQRAINFNESQSIWRPGKAKSAIWIVKQLMKEKMIFIKD